MINNTDITKRHLKKLVLVMFSVSYHWDQANFCFNRNFSLAE